MSSNLAAPPRPIPVKAILFDFDGTIADTFALAVEVYNSVAPEFGCKVVLESEIPSARRKSAKQLMAELGITKSMLPRLAATCLKQIHKKMDTVLPFQGIPEALQALKLAGFTLGILTSNSCENVQLFLEKNQLRYFDFVRPSSRLFGKAKEIRAILKSYDWQPEDLAFVGDECRDLEAGQKAKIFTVAVAWGFNLPEALLAQQPTHFVEHPQSLPTLFSLKT